MVSNDEGYSRDDVHIALRVTEAVGELAARLTERVHVRVEQGMVTLSGSVPSSEQLELLQRVATSVDGVRGVRNQLDVSGVSDAPAPFADRAASDTDGAADEPGRSADRGSTESDNLQSGNILGDLPTQR